ncbi:MAG: hypothetical protein ACJAVK_002605 [Akkermansiaceae bacterium]|jgi:hypothetical protein
MPPVHGEPSHHLATPELDLDLTIRGGHLAPLVFHLPERDVSPYALAPWRPAEYPDQPPLLSVLRGDFLCLPFGGQTDGPPHGDPANASWELLEKSERSLTLVQKASDSGATIQKIVAVRPGQHAVFVEHQISNLDGHFSYGTHPILDLSHLEEGQGRVTTSPFRWASVFPDSFANLDDGETQSLKIGAPFDTLNSVSLASGGTTDLTRYPQRPGHDDLVMMVNEAATEEQPFAWSATVLDGYLWFALKNPSDFPATLLWLSNGGRPTAPWNGRHTGRLGIEEVCSHFCHGIEISRKDLLRDEGIPTTRRFQQNETVFLKIIQGVAALPPHFEAIRSIEPLDEYSVTITDENGLAIEVTIDWPFVASQ